MASYSSCMALVLACSLALLMIGAAARSFTVGGKAGWVPPATGTMSYNDWAGKNRFLKGDSLVFKYNPSEDSVVQVNAQDYNSCSTSNPIASFKDGNTVFPFPNHGPFYFISGNSSNCNKGQKLTVVVISPYHKRFSQSPSPAPTTTVATPSPAPATTVAVPSPAPTTVLSPSPAPTTVATPSPAPVTVVAPSPAPVTVAAPSPAPTTVVAPSPAPTTVAVPSPAPTSVVASPTPTPSVAVPVASPSVVESPPSMSPGGAPFNSQPLNASPSPAPTSNTTGEKPSGSPPAAAVSYVVCAAVTVVTGVLSGVLYN